MLVPHALTLILKAQRTNKDNLICKEVSRTSVTLSFANETQGRDMAMNKELNKWMRMQMNSTTAQKKLRGTTAAVYNDLFANSQQNSTLIHASLAWGTSLFVGLRQLGWR